MGIVEVTGNAGSVERVKESKSKAPDKAKPAQKEAKDKVELSDQARALYEADQSKRIEAIREKVSSGFYFQKDVTEKVVDALLEDLKKPE